jgi:methionine synthase II (cobalamin-independent)
VHEVVRRQRIASVDVVSDGEYGKSSWNYYVYKRLGGFELRSDAAVRMPTSARRGRRPTTLVAERLERIARLVGPQRVMASTDCGFAQGPYLRRVHPTIQWAKLEALSGGAALASQRLAGAPA